MPQMAPLMWTSLFIFFITLLILFMSSNFFLKNYTPKNFIFSKKKIKKYWKW